MTSINDKDIESVLDCIEKFTTQFEEFKVQFIDGDFSCMEEVKDQFRDIVITNLPDVGLDLPGEF